MFGESKAPTFNSADLDENGSRIAQPPALPIAQDPAPVPASKTGAGIKNPDAENPSACFPNLVHRAFLKREATKKCSSNFGGKLSFYQDYLTKLFEGLNLKVVNSKTTGSLKNGVFDASVKCEYEKKYGGMAGLWVDMRSEGNFTEDKNGEKKLLPAETKVGAVGYGSDELATEYVLVALVRIIELQRQNGRERAGFDLGSKEKITANAKVFKSIFDRYPDWKKYLDPQDKKLIYAPPKPKNDAASEAKKMMNRIPPVSDDQPKPSAPPAPKEARTRAGSNSTSGTDPRPVQP